MNLEQIKNNTSKTILQFSIPAIISMILTSMVTVADGFFVSSGVMEIHSII